MDGWKFGDFQAFPTKRLGIIIQSIALTIFQSLVGVRCRALRSFEKRGGFGCRCAVVEGIPVEFILEGSTCVAMPSYEFRNCYEAFITSSDLSSELYMKPVFVLFPYPSC